MTTSPTPGEIRALLDAAGWTAYRAAQIVGMTESALGKSLNGITRMRGTHWQLLRLYAMRSERDALPPAPIS